MTTDGPLTDERIKTDDYKMSRQSQSEAVPSFNLKKHTIILKSRMSSPDNVLTKMLDSFEKSIEPLWVAVPPGPDGQANAPIMPFRGLQLERQTNGSIFSPFVSAE